MESVVDYQEIAGVQEARGYASEDIDNVKHKNRQRLFESCLPPGETE